MPAALGNGRDQFCANLRGKIVHLRIGQTFNVLRRLDILQSQAFSLLHGFCICVEIHQNLLPLLPFAPFAPPSETPFKMSEE